LVADLEITLHALLNILVLFAGGNLDNLSLALVFLLLVVTFSFSLGGFLPHPEQSGANTGPRRFKNLFRTFTDSLSTKGSLLPEELRLRSGSGRVIVIAFFRDIIMHMLTLRHALFHNLGLHAFLGGILLELVADLIIS